MATETDFGPRITPRMVVGLFVILLGTLLTLDNFDILEVEDFLAWWPTVLIALGLVHLLQPRRSKVGGTLFLLIGSVLLAANLGYLPMNVWELWPLIFVFIGISMISGTISRRRRMAAGVPADGAATDSVISALAVMSGVVRSNTSSDFRGGELTAVMGGCEFDLRGATIKRGETAVLDVFAMWGGIEIYVPRNWHVTVNGFPLLGGFEDKTYQQPDDASGHLIVKGMAVMGGVEVKNEKR